MTKVLRSSPINSALRRAGLHDVMHSGDAEPGFLVRSLPGNPWRMVSWSLPPNRPDLWDTEEEKREEALGACEAALTAAGFTVERREASLRVHSPPPERKNRKPTRAEIREVQRAHRIAVYGTDWVSIPPAEPS